MNNANGRTCQRVQPSRAARDILMALADGPKTQKDLCAETGRARRTIYAAIRNLQAAGVVEGRRDLRDTRQMVYWTTGRSRDSAGSME